MILDADDWLNTRELENFIKELKTKKEVDMYVYNCLLHNGKRKEPMFLTKMEVGKVIEYQILRLYGIVLFYSLYCAKD